MALVRRRALHRACTNADARLAGIGEGASIPVVTRRVVELCLLGAEARCGIACSRVTLIKRARDGITPGTHARLTSVCLGAGVAVIACCPVRRRCANARPRARVAYRTGPTHREEANFVRLNGRVLLNDRGVPELTIVVDPHDQTVPSDFSVAMWASPAMTAVTPVSAFTCKGVSWSFVVVSPSWPLPLYPQVQTVPSDFSATL